MQNGIEELHSVLAEISAAAEENKCGMSSEAFSALATALRALYRSKVPKTYSREEAARQLGISVRQLQRDARAAGVEFHRNGHRDVWLTEADIKKIHRHRL